jgi:hypothetical protein
MHAPIMRYLTFYLPCVMEGVAAWTARRRRGADDVSGQEQLDGEREALLCGC